MSLKANYFKLGLFVIGAIIAGVDRAGRDRIRPLVPAQAHDRDVLQRIGAGTRHRFEAQVSRRVHRRSDAASASRTTSTSSTGRWPSARATCWSRRRSSRDCWAAARPPATSRIRRTRQDGDRARPARTPRAAGDHRHELPRDRLRRPAAAVDCTIDWKPDNIVHPERAVDGRRSSISAASEIMDRLHKLDIESNDRQPQQAAGDDERPRRGDRHAGALASAASTRVLAKIETKLDSIDAKKLSDEGVALLAELRESNTELKKTAGQPGAAEAARRRRGGDGAHPGHSSTIRSFAKSIASLSRSLARDRPDRRRRRGRPRGRRSRTCARSPTTCAT